MVKLHARLRSFSNIASDWVTTQRRQWEALLENLLLTSIFIMSTFIICKHIPWGCCNVPWWRHQMEIFSALLAHCAGIHRSPVNSPHKGQWRGTLIFSLICAWIKCWVNNRDAGNVRRSGAHYDVTVKGFPIPFPLKCTIIKILFIHTIHPCPIVLKLFTVYGSITTMLCVPF